MIKVKCKFCFKKFLIFPHRKLSANFCSTQCYHSYQKQSAYPLKKCLCCKKVFQNNRNTRSRKYYCRQECVVKARYKYDFGDRTCTYCGVPFKYSPKNPFQKYCSRICQSKSQTYYFKKDFFEKINSEIKAYLLGLLYSDGCISSKSGVYVNFSSTDRELVVLFKNALRAEQSIYFFNQNYYGLTIRSQELFDSLKKLGLKERKSWRNYELSLLSRNLKRHFLRGLYDGDGSFYYDRRQNGKYIYLCAGLTCSCYNFLKEIQRIFRNELGLTTHKIVRDKEYSYQLRISRQDDIKKFVEYLYKNSNYYLKRKFNLIENFYGREV